MAEPTVQVPVSLIERAPHDDDCGAYTDTDYGPVFTSEHMCDCWKSEALSQPTPSAEPFQRPEHMSVGTTFVGRTRDTNYTSRWTRVADGLMSGMGIPHDIADIDPSTIRDVTPPEVTQ